MHRTCRVFFAVLGVVAALAAARPAERVLRPEEAMQHVGESATVCGTVVDAKYVAWSNGRPTFLNFDKPFPRHVFTAVIWGEHRARFEAPPEEAYLGKRVCVTGRIKAYKGKAEIIVRSPSQMRIVAAEPARRP